MSTDPAADTSTTEVYPHELARLRADSANLYRVRRALSALVGRHGNFCAYAGQPGEAYHCFVTGAQALWDEARAALDSTP